MSLPTKTRVGNIKVTYFQSTINVAAIASGSMDCSNDIQVPGAEIGDPVVINWANETTFAALDAYVSAANVVTVCVRNAASGGADPASSDFTGCVLHR